MFINLRIKLFLLSISTCFIYFYEFKFLNSSINFFIYEDENINFNIPKGNKTELIKKNLIMKHLEKKYLINYIKNINSIYYLNISNNPELKIIENNTLKIEAKNHKKLGVRRIQHPYTYIKYKSNHPEIIKVNDKGYIVALRPGNAIITAFGLNSKTFQIKVLAISNDGLLNNSTLIKFHAEKYQNLMIVAHPDDEILWGGANLFKDDYFVVCLTNGYNNARARDFRKIMGFTNNSGIILNYPDIQDYIIDDWSEVKNGIIKDLTIILNFKYWYKIVTYGPEGTTGHYHHKKTSEFVTKIAKKYNKYNNLYYFGKFYMKNEVPKNLKRISDKDFEYKKKEVELYNSVKEVIYKLWFHMLPYENWILASKWKKN